MDPKHPFRPSFFGGGPERRGYHHGRLKDALIEVVRSNCDDLAWAQLMTQARALHRAREAGHG